MVKRNSNTYAFLFSLGYCAFDWLTSVPAGEDDEDIGCCSTSTGRALEGSLRHPECLPIDISASDTFYGRFGQRCMEFVRSLTAFNTGCRLGAREQAS